MPVPLYIHQSFWKKRISERPRMFCVCHVILCSHFRDTDKRQTKTNFLSGKGIGISLCTKVHTNVCLFLQFLSWQLFGAGITQTLTRWITNGYQFGLSQFIDNIVGMTCFSCFIFLNTVVAFSRTELQVVVVDLKSSSDDRISLILPDQILKSEKWFTVWWGDVECQFYEFVFNFWTRQQNLNLHQPRVQIQAEIWGGADPKITLTELFSPSQKNTPPSPPAFRHFL